MSGSSSVFGSREAYLTIPPPAQQSAMHEPCLYADICHCSQIGLDQVGEGLFPFPVAQLVVCETVTQELERIPRG